MTVKIFFDKDNFTNVRGDNLDVTCDYGTDGKSLDIVVWQRYIAGDEIKERHFASFNNVFGFMFVEA